MKKMYFLVLSFLLLSVASANAQVAIGTTDDPKATLDVVASSSATAADGVIPPRVSLAQLFLKNGAYGTAQTGAIVYVNDVDGQPISGKTAAVTAPGYYYFNGAKWQTMATNPRMTLADLQSGIFAEGTIVYVTNTAGTPAGATENVTEKGYYSFDGTKWNTFGGGSAGGTERMKFESKTSAYTIALADENKLIITEGSTGGITITFPDLGTENAGFRVFVFNANPSGAMNTYNFQPSAYAAPAIAALGGGWVLWTGSKWLPLSKS